MIKKLIHPKLIKMEVYYENMHLFDLIGTKEKIFVENWSNDNKAIKKDNNYPESSKRAILFNKKYNYDNDKSS